MEESKSLEVLFTRKEVRTKSRKLDTVERKLPIPTDLQYIQLSWQWTMGNQILNMSGWAYPYRQDGEFGYLERAQSRVDALGVLVRRHPSQWPQGAQVLCCKTSPNHQSSTTMPVGFYQTWPPSKQASLVQSSVTLRIFSAAFSHLKGYELVWYWALSFVPHVAMSSAASPQKDLITIRIRQLHI